MGAVESGEKVMTGNNWPRRICMTDQDHNRVSAVLLTAADDAQQGKLRTHLGERGWSVEVVHDPVEAFARACLIGQSLRRGAAALVLDPGAWNCFSQLLDAIDQHQPNVGVWSILNGYVTPMRTPPSHDEEQRTEVEDAALPTPPLPSSARSSQPPALRLAGTASDVAELDDSKRDESDDTLEDGLTAQEMSMLLNDSAASGGGS